MNIHFRYPLIATVGIGVFAALYVLLFILRRNRSFKKGVKVANTAYLQELEAYRFGTLLHRISSVIVEAALIVACISSLILMARPYKTERINQGVRKRDIFLCMDNSIYLDTLNEELLDELIEIVRTMEGDRFGISIYCSASLLYVPMTDDYDYVIMKLEELKEYFRVLVTLDQVYGAYGWNLPEALPDDMKEGYERELNLYYDLHAEITEPTYLNAYRKGYFLTGDGLASCMYSFPKFGAEDRSRVIILSTENSRDVNARPVVELDEACELCAKNKVTVFGLFRGEKAFDMSIEPNYVFIGTVETESDYESAREDMKTNVLKTGGEFYEYGDMEVKDIVDDIRSQPAMLVDEVVINKEIDQPKAPAIVLFISLLSACLAAALRGA